MSLEIFDCPQNSPEWAALRAGIVTASELHSVLAKGEGKTRRAYMLRLAGERLTGEPAETYENRHMIRGREQEDEARQLYRFVHDAELRQVGFIRNGEVGCSPDSLIGDDGAIEIKTRLPHLQVELLLQDRFPPEHRAQVQGLLWIAKRSWCDLVVYSPNLPLYVCREFRDEGYIANLAGAVARFNEELAEIVERVRRYGARPDVTQQLRQSLEAAQ